MPTPVEFMTQYRNIRVNAVIDDPVARVCRQTTFPVQIRKYFMMDWDETSEERRDFNAVTAGGRRSDFYRANQEHILNAAMGKGAPDDYRLALEWAIISGKIAAPLTAEKVQQYADEHLGIDCSGFATNYLIAAGKKTYSSTTVRNTGAASYFDASKAVNDPLAVQRGDLLVWMNGNSVKRDPGHIAVVDDYVAQCRPAGNMRVVEATGARGANPKLLDSMYMVEGIVDQTGRVPMILVVKRHGVSGSHVVVIRP